MQLGVSLGIPYTLGKPAAVFSPLDLSPVLWLDASDTSTITESGGAVSQWDDKSGNGINVVQATAANQPTSGTRTMNGRNVLDFAGNDWLRTSAAHNITQPLHIFCVFVLDDLSGAVTAYMLDSYGASNRHYWLQSGSTAHHVNAGINKTGGTPDLNPHLFHWFSSGATSYVEIDGTAIITADTGANSYDLITIHTVPTNNLSKDAAYAEIIVVEGTLTAGEIADTESYLGDKWGITI